MKFKIIRNFRKYVNNFDVKDFAIKRKLEHSIRVMKLSEMIAKNLNLSKEDRNIAVLVGLLHDYARFHQWTKYKTYNDLESIDHGDYGVILLFENNDIEKFTLNKNYYSIIKTAIKNHNKFSVEDNLDDISKLHSEIIRDSDKIDIFNIYANKILEIKNINDKISDKVKKDFYNNKLINKKDCKNDNDEIILLLSMIYDINFKVSIEYINKKDLIWKIYNNIDDKEYLLEYFKYVDKYIEERMK